MPPAQGQAATPPHYHIRSILTSGSRETEQLGGTLKTPVRLVVACPLAGMKRREQSGWQRLGQVQALPTPSASVEMMEGVKEGARQLCQHNSSVECLIAYDHACSLSH